MSNLPSETLYIIDCLRRVSTQLGVIDDVVLIGSVGRCLGGLMDCRGVGDVDIFITGKAVERFWELIHGLLTCKPNEALGLSFQPVYDLLMKPNIIKDLWRPCQNEYYGHPLALTINCERPKKFIKHDTREDKRVNLDIKVMHDEVVRIPYSEYFLHPRRKDELMSRESIDKAHEEFMSRNSERDANYRARIIGARRFNDQVGMHYAALMKHE